jgi:transcriptional regulator with XRE-family HTH domain
MNAGTGVHIGEMLRKLRENRRLSVRTLASESGFSPSFISQVENGLASPSISSLEKIAAALQVSMADFFPPSAAKSLVITAQNRSRLDSEWSQAAIEGFGTDPASKLEPILITLRPGGTSGSRPYPLQREQFAFVVAGEATLHLNGSELTLQAGDAVAIPSRAPFRWMNTSSQATQLLIVSTRSA